MKPVLVIVRITLALGAMTVLAGMLLVVLAMSGVIGDPMVWQR